jgi:hypothetical protein
MPHPALLLLLCPAAAAARLYAFNAAAEDNVW